ncbi:MAG: tetratricopeptide repeat protein, partial [Cyanobacteria bacterium J06649_4]
MCDAVTRQINGQAQLEALECDNLFIVPLDNQRQWYRYHHLFAEVLQVRITEELPEPIADLHLRASYWYEQHSFPAEAVHHALAAEDFERAAALVEFTWRDLTRQYQNATVISWMKALPEEIICARPTLRVGYAWALMGSGNLDAMEPHMQALERWLADSEGNVVASDTEYQSLRANLAIARAYQSQTLGDFPGSVAYTQQALDHLPTEDYIQRAVPNSLLGLAHWADGDIEAAHSSFSAVVTSFQRAGDVLNTLDLRYALGEIKAAQGRLHEALNTYQQVLKIADDHSENILRGTANAYMGISNLQCEWNQLAAAAHTLQMGKSLNEQAVLPGWQHRWRIAQARIKAAQGDFERAIALLNEAKQLYYPSPMPDIRPIAALIAQLWIRQGQLAATWRWAKSQDLSLSMLLSYLREFEHITYVRLLIAEYAQNGKKTTEKKNSLFSIDEILAFLERLLNAARSAERIGSEINILVLQALAYQVKGNLSAALPPLQQAICLAEPEGYVRLFVEEGPPMEKLLKEAAKNEISLSYVRRLQAAFAKGDVETATHHANHQPL